MDAIYWFLVAPENRMGVICILLAVSRIAALISVAPFFGPGINSAVKIPLLFTFFLPALPLIWSHGERLNPDEFNNFYMIMLYALKEGMIGFLIGYISGFVFYAAMSAGMIIDNQRGASQAQGQDLILESQNSPFGAMLMLSMVNLFYATGAILGFIMIVLSSFVLWPVSDFLPYNAMDDISRMFGGGVNFVMSSALVMCSPFVLVALMTDISLGLVNRFAPQLNVFILSMPIKSGLCAILILLYIQPFMEIGSEYLDRMVISLNEFFRMLQHPTL